MSFTIKHTKTAKGAAILLLLYFHIFIGYGDYHFNLAQIAHCCVWIFVFLSGYGLTASFSKACSSLKKLPAWFFRRVWSLETFFWPHYLIGLGILYLYLHRTVHSQYGNIWRAVLDFFCLSDIFGQTHIFAVWWYMGLSLMVVLFVPLIVKVTDKIGYFIIPLSYLLILAVPDLIVDGGFIGPYQGYYLAAVLGVVSSRKGLLNRYVEYIEKAPRLYVTGLNLAFIVLGFSLGLFISGIESDLLVSLYVPQLLKTAVAVLTVLLSITLYKIRFVSSALVFLGELSDDMFILHVVLKMVLSGIVYAVDIPFMIYFTLLALSIGSALILKAIKKLVCYDKLVDKVSSLTEVKNG